MVAVPQLVGRCGTVAGTAVFALVGWAVDCDCGADEADEEREGGEDLEHFDVVDGGLIDGWLVERMDVWMDVCKS